MSTLGIGVVKVKNFAFIDDAEIELTPLTIFVGRNASGKSIVLNLIWLLLSLEPDFDKWSEILDESGASEIVDVIVDKAKRGDDIEKEFKELVKLSLKTLPKALEANFNKRFKDTFGLDPKVLSRDVGLSIEIGGLFNGANYEKVEYKVKVCYDETSGEFKIEYVNPQVFLELANNISAKVSRKTVARTAEGLQKSYVYKFMVGSQTIGESTISSDGDVIGMQFSAVGHIFTFNVFPWFATEHNVIYCVDGRAGFIRAIMRPWVKTDELRLMYPDEVFRRSYFYLADLLYDGKIDLDIVRDVLPEIGVEDIFTRFERGYRAIYVKLWNGLEVPLDIAPSGVRELIIPVLALATKEIPNVIIEEPEAHLHPAAVLALGRAIARAINLNRLYKLVLVSTHSDNMLIKLSHLVEASGLSEEKRKELGLEDALPPEYISVYLFRCDKVRRRTTIERVEVSDEGINEEEMSRIITELVNEGSFIELAKGSKPE